MGLTDTDPPVARIVRLLPLVPVMEIPVAFAAVMVKTEELPLVIVTGLALIVTVGAGVPAAKAGTAIGRSMERTQQKSFTTRHLTGNSFFRKFAEFKGSQD